MVKELDEYRLKTIDHIGWRLWRAARIWKAEFDADLQEAGQGWMSEARGAVISHLRKGGISQAELTAAMGISKQAVQQLVDELVAEGMVERSVDPADARGRIIMFTRKAAASLEASNSVKRKLDRKYRKKLGAEAFAALEQALDAFAEPEK